MFTFDIKLVAGTKHGGPDALSRRGKAEEDSENEDPDDLEVQMDLDLALVTVLPADVSPAECLDKVPQEFRRVMAYLLTLQRPDGMTDKPFNSLKQYALRFLVHEGLLFRPPKVNMSPRRVIWDGHEQKKIIKELHDQSGHRGKKGTYQEVALRY